MVVPVWRGEYPCCISIDAMAFYELKHNCQELQSTSMADWQLYYVLYVKKFFLWKKWVSPPRWFYIVRAIVYCRKKCRNIENKNRVYWERQTTKDTEPVVFKNWRFADFFFIKVFCILVNYCFKKPLAYIWYVCGYIESAMRCRTGCKVVLLVDQRCHFFPSYNFLYKNCIDVLVIWTALPRTQ